MAVRCRYGSRVAAEPVLWHIPISHYSEKARWTLAHKGIEYRARAPQPPAHMAVALAMTRGRHKTFPLLQLDGRWIGDSSAIIAALEERYPERPLYPEGEAERGRALELEEFFDEQLGPQMRLVAWYEATHDRAMLDTVAGEVSIPALARFRRVAGAGVRTFVNLRYGAADGEEAQRARGAVLAALDRLEAELDGRDHLVGTQLTVADITAAALFYPLVQPEEGPKLKVRTPSFDAFREPLTSRPGFRWVEEAFRRHRPPTLEV